MPKEGQTDVVILRILFSLGSEPSHALYSDVHEEAGNETKTGCRELGEMTL